MAIHISQTQRRGNKAERSNRAPVGLDKPPPAPSAFLDYYLGYVLSVRASWQEALTSFEIQKGPRQMSVCLSDRTAYADPVTRPSVFPRSLAASEPAEHTVNF